MTISNKAKLTYALVQHIRTRTHILVFAAILGLQQVCSPHATAPAKTGHELPCTHLSIWRDAKDGSEAESALSVSEDPAVIRPHVGVAAEVKPVRKKGDGEVWTQTSKKALLETLTAR